MYCVQMYCVQMYCGQMYCGQMYCGQMYCGQISRYVIAPGCTYVCIIHLVNQSLLI